MTLTFLALQFQVEGFFGLKLVKKGRIQDFFKEGVVSLKVQSKRPKAEGIGEGGGYGLCLNMYVFFILISFLFPFLPAYLIKQISLKEPSWMSLYKGLAYLVYVKYFGVVHGDYCEVRESLFRHR